MSLLAEYTPPRTSTRSLTEAWVSGEMPRRRLGLVGPEIAVIGFGAAALGGADSPASWGSQDDQASLAAMRRAVDHGVNWIDTAAAYGCGHSEDVIGRFLRDLPPSLRPLVFTKGGLIRSNQHGGKAFIRSLQPASVRAECEASLRRLCVDQIDMYQFHWPDETDTPVEESWVRWSGSSKKGKCGLREYRTSPWRCSNAARRSATSTPCNVHYRSSDRRLQRKRYPGAWPTA
jgi:aryl-alcohol dehydrogenase-like predicted oxidoreductase